MEKVEGEKRIATGTECKSPREESEVGGFMAQKVVDYRQKEDVERQRSTAKVEGDSNQKVQRHAR